MKISVVSNFKLYHRLALSSVEKNKDKEKYLFTQTEVILIEKSAKCFDFCMHVEEIGLYSVLK